MLLLFLGYDRNIMVYGNPRAGASSGLSTCPRSRWVSFPSPAAGLIAINYQEHEAYGYCLSFSVVLRKLR